MTRDIEGKVALVTGSTSGIGAAIARGLGASGARVVINSRSSPEAGEALASELRGHYIRGDIGVEQDARQLVAETVDTYGQLDVLVNNAGITRVIPHDDLDALTAEVWREIFDVNVLGTWLVTQAAVPHLRESGDGSIVTITSLAGVRGGGSSIPYAVTKAALNHLTVLLARILGPTVRVNAVAPGLIDTPWTSDWDAVREFVRRRAPLGRSGSPDEVAEVALGLIASKYVTGEVILVDGGMHLA